ncbi:MAG: ribonuclease Z [Patescibacteria group bacterium]
MKLTFLGTNGWFDNTSTGNTPCAIIDAPEAYVVLDAGFGFAKLDKYIKSDKPIYVFITHLHLDHTCGFHTLPKFDFKQGLTILFPKKMEKFLQNLLNHPYMMPLKELPYSVKLIGLKEGEHQKPIKFISRALKHVDSTMGYRLFLDKKIISYCSDTAICENDFLLAQDCDLLIHECSFKHKVDNAWGHTGPEEAAELAQKANVKKLVLTHFGANGYNTLGLRKQAEQVAKGIFPNSTAALDGLEMDI